MAAERPPGHPKGSHHTYLGDGAYVCLSEYREVIVYSSNGLNVLERVLLERTALDVLTHWIEKTKDQVVG